MHMKHGRNLAVAGCSLLLLCQCASQTEVRDLNYQVRAVNQKVEEIRGTEVDQMQKRQASSVSRLEQMENEIAQLRSLVEEKSHQEGQLREQEKQGFNATVEKTLADNDTRLKTLEERIAQLETNLDKMSEARVRDAEARARDAAKRVEDARKRGTAAADEQVSVRPDRRKTKLEQGKKAAATAAPPAEKAPVASASKESASAKRTPAAAPGSAPGGDQFSKAMGLYKAKQYGDAYKAFEQVLAQNPRGDQAAETLFYMGESPFANGEYDLAILDYQKVISNHADHPRTPTALLKQGMSFEKLTDHETAKIIYKKLIAEHPQSAEATTAQQQLAGLQ